MSEPQWEQIWAYVGPPQGWVYAEDTEGEPTEGPWEKYTEFFVQVIYNNRVYYSKQLVDNNQLAGYDECYAKVLDYMVEAIDETIMRENG